MELDSCEWCPFGARFCASRRPRCSTTPKQSSTDRDSHSTDCLAMVLWLGSERWNGGSTSGQFPCWWTHFLASSTVPLGDWHALPQTSFTSGFYRSGCGGRFYRTKGWISLQERILGSEHYSPLDGQDYFYTGGTCEVAPGYTAECGFVIDYRDYSTDSASLERTRDR